MSYIYNIFNKKLKKFQKTIDFINKIYYNIGVIKNLGGLYYEY